MSNPHLTPYSPVCRCSHCTRVADAAHRHYQGQAAEIVEQNKRLLEMVPEPPSPIRIPTDWHGIKERE